jgi:hypothetical protein
MRLSEFFILKKLRYTARMGFQPKGNFENVKIKIKDITVVRKIAIEN